MADGDFQSQLMGYDRASTLFSPEGRIFQVEYAEKTVRLGADSMGFVCKDGVLLMADKRMLDSLMVGKSIFKIYEIDNHIIASAAGILSDARVLIERAQLYAQQHRVTFDDDVEIEAVVRDICNIKQAFTQYGGVRPFGVQIMLAGINIDGSKRLYVTDVTGNYNAYYAFAIGEHDEKIKEILRKEYRESTINETIKFGLKIFKKILGKDFNYERIDVMYVRDKDRKAVKLDPEDIKKLDKEK
ncbi:MAG: archaeal proteasome endopeptidase complex subunit alpha [Candidatus Pacearchaeota archaeon]